MQTEWSSGREDEQVGGPTSRAEPPEPTVEVDLPAPPVDAATGSAVDTPLATDPAGEDGTAGEEESHRTAVDAVDGLLDEVELAMARLDDGTYGRCETCGVPIDDAELAAGPLVRECTPCSTGALALEGA